MVTSSSGGLICRDRGNPSVYPVNCFHFSLPVRLQHHHLHGVGESSGAQKPAKTHLAAIRNGQEKKRVQAHSSSVPTTTTTTIIHGDLTSIQPHQAQSTNQTLLPSTTLSNRLGLYQHSPPTPTTVRWHRPPLPIPPQHPTNLHPHQTPENPEIPPTHLLPRRKLLHQILRRRAPSRRRLQPLARLPQRMLEAGAR